MNEMFLNQFSVSWDREREMRVFSSLSLSPAFFSVAYGFIKKGEYVFFSRLR